MNRSRSRTRRRQCAIATTLAMTMGIWGLTGAWGQTAGPGAAGPTNNPGQRGTTTTPPGGAAGRGPTGTGGAGTGGGTAAPGTAAPGTGATPGGSAGAAASAPTVAPAVAAPVTVPPAAYSDPDKNRAAVDSFVDLNVQNLLNDGNPDAQAKARDVLTAATMTAGAPASPTFLFNYGQSLNNVFSAKLGSKDKLSVRQRLNIAVVTAKVAYMASNITLQQTTLALLKDEAEPVVIWALRAAQPQVPLMLGMKGVGNKVPPMIPAITKAVFDHPSGPVFEEGYQALEGNDKAIADALMELWQNRLTQYQTKVPQDPSADGRPAFKLSTKDMWQAVVNKPQIQQKVMQMVVDQMSAAQQWADQLGGEDTHAQLVALARQCAGACVVIGGHQNKPELTSAGNAAFGALDPKTFRPGDKVEKSVRPVVDKVLASFKGVQQPPKVGPTPAGNPGAAGVAGQP